MADPLRCSKDASTPAVVLAAVPVRRAALRLASAGRWLEVLYV